MKRIAKWLAIGIVVLVVGLLAVGMMLDGSLELNSTRDVKAPAPSLYALAATPAGVKLWWADAAKEYGEDVQGMTIEAADGPPEPGAKVRFKVGDTLYEEWTLKVAVPHRKVVWAVDFQMFEVLRVLSFEPTAEGTKMTWVETAEIINPLMRVMMNVMPSAEVLENHRKAMDMMGRRALELAAAASPTGV